MYKGLQEGTAMIARIILPLLLVIILPDLYIHLHYLRRRKNYRLWKGILWYTPTFLFLAIAICMAFARHFAPENTTPLFLYLLAVGLFVVPKACFALCSSIGLLICRLRKKHANWGNLIGLLLGLFAIYVIIYGSTIGVNKLRVRHVDISFNDLPKEFDGYKIVLFSDAHVGTFAGNRMKWLARDIDSINAQQADMIAFVGDIQNMRPSEIYPVRHLLSSLHAKDGVYSVLGNHDYSLYVKDNDIIKAANERETISREIQLGWKLLRNENREIHRGNSKIVIAGGENSGDPPFPNKLDIKKTMAGTDSTDFVIMLQHDPSAWKKTIIPETHAQLTFSGHTHGGQISILGLRMTKFRTREDYGLYKDKNRALYVTCGIGGFLPIRFGMPSEIVVITLKHKP